MGRRAVIAICYSLMIFFIWATPYSHTVLKSSSKELLKFCRVVVTVCVTFLETSPLTVDYIRSESQGAATSYVGIGTQVGGFIGMSALMNVCDEWDQKQAFGLCAAVVAIISSVSMFWIRDAPRKTPLEVGADLAAKAAKKAGVEPQTVAVQPADVEKGDDDFKKAENATANMMSKSISNSVAKKVAKEPKTAT